MPNSKETMRTTKKDKRSNSMRVKVEDYVKLEAMLQEASSSSRVVEKKMKSSKTPDVKAEEDDGIEVGDVKGGKRKGKRACPDDKSDVKESKDVEKRKKPKKYTKKLTEQHSYLYPPHRPWTIKNRPQRQDSSDSVGGTGGIGAAGGRASIKGWGVRIPAHLRKKPGRKPKAEVELRKAKEAEELARLRAEAQQRGETYQTEDEKLLAKPRMLRSGLELPKD